MKYIFNIVAVFIFDICITLSCIMLYNRGLHPETTFYLMLLIASFMMGVVCIVDFKNMIVKDLSNQMETGEIEEELEEEF